MKKELIFFRCPICGNIVVKLHDSGMPVFCCGKPMEILNANINEDVGEKHLPMVFHNGNVVNIKVGNILHPHTEEHYIEFVILETNKGVYTHYFDFDEEPTAEFALLEDEKPINAYAYCNIHSLWKTKLN